MPAGCRTGDPLAGVHHPARIKVLNPCIAVTGTVLSAHRNSDGDIKFNLKPDAGGQSLINERNETAQGGSLVCEIVPADQPGCVAGKHVAVRLGLMERIDRWFKGPYEFGICTGAAIPVPVVASHVSVVGPFVTDLAHGWNEIHPVWSITDVNSAPG
jgi:hypothetical protein